MAIRVIVVDDHQIIGSGLQALLPADQFQIVGQADDSDQMQRLLGSDDVDLVVMDVRLNRWDGLGLLEQLRTVHANLPVVVFTAFDNPTYVARAAALGASDFIQKSAPGIEVITTFLRAARREPLPENSLLRRIQLQMHRRKEPSDNNMPLTNREFQVLRHIAFGLSNREIGYSLGISIETVKEHVQNILRKIDATDRTQAAVWAVRNGLQK